MYAVRDVINHVISTWIAKLIGKIIRQICLPFPFVSLNNRGVDTIVSIFKSQLLCHLEVYHLPLLSENSLAGSG